jgi:cyclic pyranopterin phosphate synthase
MGDIVLMNIHTGLETPAAAAPLVDPFGRAISYIRVSVTDRCDFRCVYCMSEDMNFLPKGDLLTLEELDRLCTAFVTRGTKKIRITGGEPLLRPGLAQLVARITAETAAAALRSALAQHLH